MSATSAIESNGKFTYKTHNDIFSAEININNSKSLAYLVNYLP